MTDTPPPLTDRFGRTVTYLRLSVTDRCDLRCTYCMPERMQFLPRRDVLSLEELEEIATAFIRRGVRKIRITGGEPLVRRDVRLLFQRLGTQLGTGLDELTLTTNATRLADHAAELAKAGVRRVNVSLDTVDAAAFRRISRNGDLAQVLRGIEAAQAAGLKVKINTVVLKEDNVAHIPTLIEWAHERGIDVTLIEVMPLGETGEARLDQFYPLTELQATLATRWTLSPLPAPVNGGPSRYQEIAETGGRVGFISPLTENFCAGCNRVRVSCTGRIYMCLGREDYVDLRAALRETVDPAAALNTALDQALGAKPEAHDFAIDEDGQNGPARHMSLTGG